MIDKNRLLKLDLCNTITHPEWSMDSSLQGAMFDQTNRTNRRGTEREYRNLTRRYLATIMPILVFSLCFLSVPSLGAGVNHPGFDGPSKGMVILLGAQFWVILNAVLVLVAILAIAAVLFMRKEFDRKKEKVAYNNRLLELEAKALTSQMNPHFIYNSLSTVQHLIVLNEQQKAFDYISDFSLLMRQMLNNSRKSYVALEDEIDFLTRYMELERFRFSNSFEYEFQVEDALKVHSHCIAPMLIQPILENAIKHGMGPKKEKGILKISFSFHKDILECVVDDNGAGWKKTRSAVSSLKHESTALNIIRERLNVIKSYDDNPGKLEIIDKSSAGYPESGTVVKIFIPIINSL
jgi:hypothetical protein